MGWRQGDEVAMSVGRARQRGPRIVIVLYGGKVGG